MPVINCSILERYKTYYEEKVKGKDGITRPLTKVMYIKKCPQCHGGMHLDYFKKGGVHTSPIIRWKCPDKHCKHSEREPGNEDLREDE